MFHIFSRCSSRFPAQLITPHFGSLEIGRCANLPLCVPEGAPGQRMLAEDEIVRNIRNPNSFVTPVRIVGISGVFRIPKYPQYSPFKSGGDHSSHPAHIEHIPPPPFDVLAGVTFRLRDSHGFEKCCHGHGDRPLEPASRARDPGSCRRERRPQSPAHECTC